MDAVLLVPLQRSGEAEPVEHHAGRPGILARLVRRRPLEASSEASVSGPDLLLERTAQALARTDVVGGAVAVFVIEVAPAMDDVARQVVRRLRAWLPPEDVVVQLSAGTFGVLIEGVGPDGCDGMARRMTALLGEPMTCGGSTTSVTFAIGIAISTATDDLVPAAHEALHAAQRGDGSGRARWATFDQALRAHAVTQGSLELELRTALQHKRIRAVFQPIFRSESDLPIAMEALARWTRADGTDVAPQRFVPLAETAGLGPALGLQVLECGLDAVAAWYADGHQVGRLAVNLGQSQLDDGEFPAALAAQLARRELPPSCLVVEVPAGALVETDAAVAAIGRLHSLGVEVVLDDFGASGASLAALRRLPLSGVKLDRSLLTDETLLSAAISLCRNLGLRCVVKNVETHDQLDAARRLGADAVQGYLLGRPAGAREVSAMLAKARRSAGRDLQ